MKKNLTKLITTYALGAGIILSTGCADLMSSGYRHSNWNFHKPRETQKVALPSDNINNSDTIVSNVEPQNNLDSIFNNSYSAISNYNALTRREREEPQIPEPQTQRTQPKKPQTPNPQPNLTSIVNELEQEEVSPNYTTGNTGCSPVILTVGDSLVGSYEKQLRKLCPNSKIISSDGAENSSRRVKGSHGPGVRGDYVARDGKNTTEMVRDFYKALNVNNNIDTVIVVGGINDILGGTSATKVIDNLSSMYSTAKEKGLRVIGSTLVPAGGNSKMTQKKQQALEKVNYWIKNNSGVDAVAESYNALSDPNRPTWQRPSMVDKNMKLHPVGNGRKLYAKAHYQALENAPYRARK